jgi:hypothetical protein
MHFPNPKDLRVGTVLFLPKIKPIKGLKPREGLAPTRCEREACNSDCSMDPSGWDHPVIVVSIHKANEAQTKGITISFVQVFLFSISF